MQRGQHVNQSPAPPPLQVFNFFRVLFWEFQEDTVIAIGRLQGRWASLRASGRAQAGLFRESKCRLMARRTRGAAGVLAAKNGGPSALELRAVRGEGAIVVDPSTTTLHKTHICRNIQKVLSK